MEKSIKDNKLQIELIAEMNFEKKISESGGMVFTEEHKINKIRFNYEPGFKQVTLYIGDTYHIHLRQKDFKKLLNSLNILEKQIQY